MAESKEDRHLKPISEVQCAVKVNHIFKISDVDNSFTADFVVMLRWTDPVSARNIRRCAQQRAFVAHAHQELVGKRRFEFTPADIPRFQIKNAIGCACCRFPTRVLTRSASFCSLDVDGAADLSDNPPKLLNDQGLIDYTIRYRGN